MQRAGQAFRRAADIYRKHLEGGAIDAATQEHEAFKCFRKDSPQEAADALNSAIKFYSRQNPRRAATHLETLAKFYEEDVKDQRKAMEAYGEAAEKFEYDNAGSLANKNKIKHAEYLALLDANYFQASKEFEDVAEAYNNLGTMKYSVPEVLLKAGICQLATGDMVGARKKFEEKYPEISSANPFPQARESKFLNDLVQAVENGDPEASVFTMNAQNIALTGFRFSMSCFQWDQMSKLDTWKT